jgi:hypothetical protein
MVESGEWSTKGTRDQALFHMLIVSSMRGKLAPRITYTSRYCTTSHSAGLWGQFSSLDHASLKYIYPSSVGAVLSIYAYHRAMRSSCFCF